MSAVSEGERRAKIRASQNRSASQALYLLYGRTLRGGCGGAPVGLAVGHLMRVNPKGETSPPANKDSRAGLMLITSSECLAASVAWSAVENVQLNVYAWGTALDVHAQEIEDACGDLLGKPNETFWRLTYMRMVMGPTAFTYFWEARDMTAADPYQAFMTAIEVCDKTVAGWSVPAQNKVLLQDCPYTFNIALGYGPMVTKTFGNKPSIEFVNN